VPQKPAENKKPVFEDLLATTIKKEEIIDSKVINSLKSTSLTPLQNENKNTTSTATKSPGDLFEEHNFEINIDLSVPINSKT
jgi:hypothetical protein